MLYPHHIAVQAIDFDNTIRWYEAFFNCNITWMLDAFSSLTMSRLPGIVRLAELHCDQVRFHIFERTSITHADTSDCSPKLVSGPPALAPVVSIASQSAFQHIGLAVPSAEALLAFRDRWIVLYQSGLYRFARDDQPTEIVVDGDGVGSLYVLDVNGLEYEFTYLPGREVS